MYRNLSVGVVVPAHDEERLIAATLRAMPGFVDLVVAGDDASLDATYARMREVASSDDRVVTIRRLKNRGVGAAVVTGYRAALGAGVDLVAVMDGDGQMDPRNLSRLLDPLVDGRADLTKGNRFSGVTPRGPMPTARVAGNLLLSAATRIVVGFGDALDAQCGYTSVVAAELGRLPLERLYPRYGYPNDMVIRASEAGLRLESVPMRAVYGEEVSGIRPAVVVPRIAALLARAATLARI